MPLPGGDNLHALLVNTWRYCSLLRHCCFYSLTVLPYKDVVGKRLTWKNLNDHRCFTARVEVFLSRPFAFTRGFC